jgi:hypothetical protein
MPTRRKMISDLDIYRAANLVHQAPRCRGGRSAMVERMLELGDVEGRDLWRRIRRAIETLQAPADGVRH